MNPHVEQLAGFLDELDVRYEVSRDAEVLQLGFGGDHVNYRAFVGERDGLLTAMCRRIAVVPRERQAEAIMLANRVNSEHMRWGTFWVSTDACDLSFEVSAPLLGDPCPEHAVMLLAALCAVDHFYPSFAQVIWGAVPATAVSLGGDEVTACTSLPPHTDLEI